MHAKIICLAIFAAGCATVTVKQEKPIEIKVRVDIYEHAEQVVDDLTTPLPKGSKPKGEHQPQPGRESVFVATSGGAERSLDEIKNAIRGRSAKVRSLKTSGGIGEDSRGYLKQMIHFDSKQKEAELSGIVESENNDRRALYEKEAATQKKTLAEIESAFAAAWQKKAETGDWVEENGKWKKK